MCLFTHFAAGALAGGATGNVWWGAAAGLASHAVLDAIPHYDHPDWRLEMVGGALGLGLLLLMPFASAAAVVGGLLGMAPDLENLFQKLGKMKRSQFIFPTHTGLIPHGRTLAPASLVWQVVIFAACFGVLALVTPGQTLAAEPTATAPLMGMPQVTVLETGANATRLRVDFPVLAAPDDWSTVRVDRILWTLPPDLDEDFRGPDGTVGKRMLPPRLDLSLAVPTLSPVKVSLNDLAWWRAPRNPVSSLDVAAFGRPAVFRQVPVTAAGIPQAVQDGVLRSVTLTVNHAASPRYLRQMDAAKALDMDTPSDQAVRALLPTILNPDLFNTLSRGGREVLRAQALANTALKGQFNHFDLSDNWVRLDVTATGLYRLTGQDLSGMGVATTGVDPLKLRLFKGGGQAVDVDPERPEADQPERVGLTEIAIEVIGAEDGEWNLDDEIRFYGFGSSVWLDRLDDGAGRLEFYDHPYAATGVYWLNWEAVAEASDIPGAPLRVSLVNEAAGGGPVRDVVQVRLHREDQQLDMAGWVGDNWAWTNSVSSTRTESFQAPAAVTDSLATWILDFRGYAIFGTGGSYPFAADGYVNGYTAGMSTTSFTSAAQHDSVRCRLTGLTDQVIDGTNTLTLRNSGTPPKLNLILDSFDVAYWARLDLGAHPDQVLFSLWQEQALALGRHDDLRLQVPGGATALLWDVSDPRQCRVLSGTRVPGQVTYGLSHQPATDRQFVACAASDLLAVAHGSVVHPRNLRGETTDLHYIVVYPAGFLRAAEDLESFRDGHLPGIPAPRAKAVLVDDIYDNFSGGQKDPLAIRNYLRNVYLSGGNLQFVCLLGNASRDYRNHQGQAAYEDLFDLIPMDLRTFYPAVPSQTLRLAAYASDDGLVSFDSAPVNDLDIPDVAIGRLPATTINEARDMVERVIAYDRDTEAGIWRNQILMTADDADRPGNPYPTVFENIHTLQAELISNHLVPTAIDLQKTYGVDYDFPPGSMTKPQMRSDINAALNKGTTIFYYVGHGAEDNLADEQIFQSRDIANLLNGMQRPMFIAFSCDVGVYDSPIRRSMAETFLDYETGGAIGSICASQVSYIGNNNSLSSAFYGILFPDRQVSETMTPGVALVRAKATMTDYLARRNSQRYNLLGDPATRLPHPLDDLAFATDSTDTLWAGARQEARLNETKMMLAAGDAYHLRVEESAYFRVYYVYIYNGTEYVPAERSFLKYGNPVFRGTGTMTGNELVVPFKVPTQLRYGDQGRVRLVLGNLDGEHSVAMAVPSMASATGPADDIHGPAIGLAFENNKYRVRAGDPFTATLNDTSGIAILGTSPGNSILLEFDDTGFMTDVTENFHYDPDSYQQGRLEIPLPGDLELGKHKAALHASDALGNVGSDTLGFLLVPAGVAQMADVTLFPNPTSGPCRLLFELSDPMAVRWEIYTLAGHRIKTLADEFPVAGPGIMEWDGRDDQGDEIANGTYLYVLRGTYRSDVERDLTQTGKLVIMR